MGYLLVRARGMEALQPLEVARVLRLDVASL